MRRSKLIICKSKCWLGKKWREWILFELYPRQIWLCRGKNAFQKGIKWVGAFNPGQKHNRHLGQSVENNFLLFLSARLFMCSCASVAPELYRIFSETRMINYPPRHLSAFLRTIDITHFDKYFSVFGTFGNVSV